MWQHRLPDGTRGLSKEQKRKKYIIAGDKNNQFLGACSSQYLPDGVPYRVVPGKYFTASREVAFWQYKLQDVAPSWFTGYDMYCPLSTFGWASTALLNFAIEAGIQFHVNQGIVWKKEDILPLPMRTWYEIMRDAIESLKDELVYPDAIARQNATATIKKMYVEMIGLLCNAEHGEEYYHPDWNMFIIHKAIANQGQSFLIRREKLQGNVILVSNDQFYLLSDYSNPYEEYGGLFTNEKLVKGYKPTGVYPLTDEVIEAFETQKDIIKLEYAIEKQGAIQYVTP
jgi:hypothetical protein